MSLDDDHRVTLRAEITQAVRESTGLNERLATDIASAILTRIQQRWGMDRIYIPATTRDEIRARNRDVKSDLAVGLSDESVCRRHHISRSTLYRIKRGEYDDENG